MLFITGEKTVIRQSILILKLSLSNRGCGILLKLVGVVDEAGLADGIHANTN